MANILVPQKPQPLSGSVRDEGAIIAWGVKFPRGYTFNVYWEPGTFSAPPSSPLANSFSVGVKSTQESIRAGYGIVPVTANTNIYVEVTSVTPGGVESARSPMLFLSMTNAEDISLGFGRDESGQPKSLSLNEDGSLLTAPGAPAPGASTSALQITGNTSLASIDGKLPAGGLASEAKQDAQLVDSGVIAGDTTSIDGKTPALGQAAMAASVPVVLASNQSSVGTKEDAFTAALQTIVSVAGASVALPAVALTGRRLIAIQNRGATPLLVNTGIATSSSWEVAPGGSLRLGLGPGVTVQGIRAAGTSNVVVWEFA